MEHVLVEACSDVYQALIATNLGVENHGRFPAAELDPCRSVLGGTVWTVQVRNYILAAIAALCTALSRGVYDNESYLKQTPVHL